MTLGLSLSLGQSSAIAAGYTPVAARYWRVFIPQECTGNGSAIAIAEMDWLDDADASLTGSGTWAADNASFGAVANIHDGNASTYWAASGDYNHWVRFDAGVGNTISPTKVSVTSRNDGTINANQSPSSMEIQYSDDASTWTTVFVWTNNAQSWASPETKSIEFPAGAYGAPARAWGIWAKDSADPGNAITMAEMEIRASSTDLTGSGTPILVHVKFGTAADIFDNATDDFAGGNDAQGIMFAYDFGTDQSPDDITVRARTGTDSDQTPSDGFVVSSQDGERWFLGPEFTGLSWTTGEQKTLSTT